MPQRVRNVVQRHFSREFPTNISLPWRNKKNRFFFSFFVQMCQKKHREHQESKEVSAGDIKKDLGCSLT